jgi:hypothetical protein
MSLPQGNHTVAVLQLIDLHAQLHGLIGRQGLADQPGHEGVGEAHEVVQVPLQILNFQPLAQRHPHISYVRCNSWKSPEC